MSKKKWVLMTACGIPALLVLAVAGLYLYGLWRQSGRQVEPRLLVKILPCERLLYDVTSPLGESGTITVEVSPLLTLEDGRNAYRITYTLHTVPAVAAIYVLKGQVTTLIDARTLLPLEYEQQVVSGLGIKGGERKHEKLVYDRTAHTLTYYKEPDGQEGVWRLKNTRPIPPDAQHFTSLFYFIRDINMQPDGQLNATISDRKRDFPVIAAVLREEDYEAPDGATRQAVVLHTKSDFGKEEVQGADFLIWLDKEDRYPVRIDAKTKWGTISGKLVNRTIITPSSETNERSRNHTGTVSVDPAPGKTPS